MDSNGFYMRILKKIKKIYPENEFNEKMHSFSNILMNISQNNSLK